MRRLRLYLLVAVVRCCALAGLSTPQNIGLLLRMHRWLIAYLSSPTAATLHRLRTAPAPLHHHRCHPCPPPRRCFQDVALYGGLCALASFDRQELKVRGRAACCTGCTRCLQPVHVYMCVRAAHEHACACATCQWLLCSPAPELGWAGRPRSHVHAFRPHAMAAPACTHAVAAVPPPPPPSSSSQADTHPSTSLLVPAVTHPWPACPPLILGLPSRVWPAATHPWPACPPACRPRCCPTSAFGSCWRRRQRYGGRGGTGGGGQEHARTGPGA